MPAQPDQRPLEAKLNLVKLPKDAKLTYTLDKTTPWVATLLAEMNEEATDKRPEAWLDETELKLQLELHRKWTKMDQRDRRVPSGEWRRRRALRRRGREDPEAPDGSPRFPI